MKNLSLEYKRQIRTLLRFATIMFFVALLIGFLGREFGRMVSYEKLDLVVEDKDSIAGVHLQSSLLMNLLHGHIFTMGAIIPVVISAMLILGRFIGGAEIKESTLQHSIQCYILGICISLILSFYKAFIIELSVRKGNINFGEIEDSLFFGIKPLRSILYGLSHIFLTVGLCLFSFSYWKSLTGDAMKHQLETDKN